METEASRSGSTLFSKQTKSELSMVLRVKITLIYFDSKVCEALPLGEQVNEGKKLRGTGDQGNLR